MFRLRSTIALCAATWFGLAGAANAQGLESLSIVIFGPPSLGAFLPPIIKTQKLDEKNGLSITFEERTPDAYTAQFNSGEFQLGGSAALLTVGLADIRGVKVTYLFNLFDYWGTVVTSRAEVNSLRDIEGKDLAAAKGTTNYVMFAYREAGEWTTAHPEEAAKLIMPKGTDDDRKAVAELIRANDRLGMNIRTAAEVSKEIKSVFDAGRSIAFLPSDPSPATIYDGPMK